MMTLFRAALVAALLIALTATPALGAKGGNGKGQARGLASVELVTFALRVEPAANPTEVVYLATPDDPTWAPAGHWMSVRHTCIDAEGNPAPPGAVWTPKALWWPSDPELGWTAPPTGPGDAYFYTFGATCTAYVFDLFGTGEPLSPVLTYPARVP
jgi:hypothetical protein